MAAAVLLPGWANEESGSWAVWGTRENQEEMDEKEEKKVIVWSCQGESWSNWEQLKFSCK